MNDMKEGDLIKFIGCCGAYCKTCQPYVQGFCKGCKLGYDNKKRDISKAKCPMKVCCIRDKKLVSCADCNEYDTCKILQGFYAKKGYKYRKYNQATEYIRKNSYKKFLASAEKWSGAYGKLE